LEKELDKAIKSTLISGIKLLSILFLSVGFLGLGMLKLVGQPEIVEHFKIWNIPSYFMYILGIFEILLAIGVFYTPIRKNTALIIAIFMILVSGFHILKGDFSYLLGPSFILLLTLALYIIETKSKSSHR
jgi:hypothetical protein